MSVFVVNHNVAFHCLEFIIADTIIPSTLFAVAVILVTLFANIYYNHQCLECIPIIGLYFLICMFVKGFYYLDSYISQTCI